MSTSWQAPSRRMLQVCGQTRCAIETAARTPASNKFSAMNSQRRAESTGSRHNRTVSAVSTLIESSRSRESQSAQAQSTAASEGSPSIFDLAGSRARQRRQEAVDEMSQPFTRAELERQAYRIWQVGDVYAPHDLTGVEASKFKATLKLGRSKGKDIFDRLKINPLNEYKNFALMAEFVTPVGKIRHSNVTGLRPVNQRRIAKAIRRATGCGLMPRTYMHPELLKRDSDWRRRL